MSSDTEKIDLTDDIATWLKKRPKWLQVAAKHLLESGTLDDSIISELTLLCQKEASNEFPDTDFSIPDGAFDVHDSEEIRLSSISEISGVNALAPQKPLDFGKSNVTVIYGLNGSGKSGYVRLLKHICGARDCVLGQLHKNVFSEEKTDQKATVSFFKGGKSEEHEWKGLGVCDDLRSVDVFDTSFGRVFMGDGEETCYEPPILSFFSELANVCDKVADKLDVEKQRITSKMPNVPLSLLGSTGIIWFEKLSAQTPTHEVEAHCSFTLENEAELEVLQKRIAETSPAKKAEEIIKKKNHADDLVNDVKTYLDKLSDKNCEKIIMTKNKFRLKKKAAEEAAKNIFSDAKLKGVGTDIWKELWKAAQKYSEEVAYSGNEFPHTQGDSVCVLCHQSLSEKAKQRFISFEKHVKNTTEQEAGDAETIARQAIEDLPDMPSIEVLQSKIDAAGTENSDIIKAINNTVAALRDRKEKLKSPEPKNALASPIPPLEWIQGISNISKDYETSITAYEEDAKKDNRAELQNEIKNLRANKWLFEQKIAIEEEVKRLQRYDQIQIAKKKASSKALSDKKGELAKMLITDAFVQRFNDELKALGASHLKVKLIKTKVSKGKVLHALHLDGVTHSINDILSEGENRIVSIAAFLADVTGRTYSAPVVFDDPISSLDQNYEEAFVNRLCSMASEKQVIIFTHRLSLMAIVKDQAKKIRIEPEITCILQESWGTGEPGGTPFFVKKLDTDLNKLIHDRLLKAKKILTEDGKKNYEIHAKALCSDFRILLECMIERELLAGIVERYRPAIHTKGKIGNLAKISKEDCEYFNDLMTKYSKYVHSQPLDAPVQLPEPDELNEDFNGLKAWQKEFKDRSQ